jgi:hypothetical protein
MRRNALIRMARRVDRWLDRRGPDPSLETPLEKDLWELARSLRLAGEDPMSEFLAAQLGRFHRQREHKRIADYVDKCRAQGAHDIAENYQGLLEWHEREAMALSREQINREMEEYSRIRGEMHDRVGKGVVSACDDIYRRVFEEGWYGRTVHDVIYERQLPGAEKGPNAEDDEQKQIEDIRQSFYRTQEQSQEPGHAQDQGMEP